MKLNIIGASAEMRQGVEHLSGLLGITLGTDGIPVRLEKIGTGLSVSREETGYVIGYNRVVEFYRVYRPWRTLTRPYAGRPLTR